MAFQNGQHLAKDTNLSAHAPLGEGNDSKVLLAGNTGDETVRIRILFKPFPDHGAGGLGCIGVADIQRNILFTDGENGSLVKNL